MAADLGVLQRLPKIVPPGVAREMAYTGERLGAERALADRPGQRRAARRRRHAGARAAAGRAASPRSRRWRSPAASWRSTTRATTPTADALEQMTLLQSAIFDTDEMADGDRRLEGQAGRGLRRPGAGGARLGPHQAAPNCWRSSSICAAPSGCRPRLAQQPQPARSLPAPRAPRWPRPGCGARRWGPAGPASPRGSACRARRIAAMRAATSSATAGSPGRWYGISGTWPTFITKYGVIGGRMSSSLHTPCSVSATRCVLWVWITQRASGAAVVDAPVQRQRLARAVAAGLLAGGVERASRAGSSVPRQASVGVMR